MMPNKKKWSLSDSIYCCFIITLILTFMMRYKSKQTIFNGIRVTFKNVHVYRQILTCNGVVRTVNCTQLIASTPYK